ncbi:MAG: phosphatidate cytidylyltransferase [Bacteroidetes bacterium]|nr:phosphatidate cytidylyltransferase [Bacteroidota bacterium]
MSNTATRILVGVIGIPLFLFLIFKGGVYFLVLSIILSGIALWEFYTMFKSIDLHPFKVFPIILSVVLLITGYMGYGVEAGIILAGITMICSAEIFRKKQPNPLNSLVSVFGLFYIAVSFLLLNKIIYLEQFNYIIYIFILIWTCDSMAFFGGKFLGKHKLSEISPKKTWEGSVTGLIFTLIASYLFYYFSNGKLTLMDAVVMGFIIGIFSQIGDLFESLFKRKLNVKDSSHIIPGHGGVLDRFDSLIFVTPLIFIYLTYFKNIIG